MILIVDMNYKKDSLGFSEFVSPIVTIVEKLDEYSVRHFSEIRHDDISRCRKVILSGTSLKDHATLQQVEKFQWIKGCDKPVLGICAGMQTIGLVFGTRLSDCVEIGMTETSTLKENILFSSKFKVYELHNYSVPTSTDFDVLAESEQCIQAFKHKKKVIYGVLFHPEVRNKDVLQRFVLAKA
jgi:GMP synthase-like glutamine amidotransferase